MIKKIILENKGKCIIILIAILGLITIILLNNNLNKEIEFKNFKNKDYVFTSIEQNKNTKCPNININSDEIDKINNEIIEKYYLVITNKSNKMDYKYSINNNVLSLIITVTNKDAENDIEKKEFISYNIDLNTKKMLKNDELLKMYNLSQSEINNKVYAELRKAYEEEAKDFYIESGECDYDCYLIIHEVDDLNSKLVYYINEKNKILGYLNHELETIYFEKNNYKEFKYEYLLN